MVSLYRLFQHTAARRRLVVTRFLVNFFNRRFNTQPPEGGWRLANDGWRYRCRFNTQPPEGGWFRAGESCAGDCLFQHTAARRRLEDVRHAQHRYWWVSTHSRPKAAGREVYRASLNTLVSTHSRPKAAGEANRHHGITANVSTHSRPKAAGAPDVIEEIDFEFQHTAARRRLGSK